MSAIPLGSTASLTLGASALLGYILSPSIPQKVAAEPEFIQDLQKNNQSLLLGRIYESVYLEQQAYASSDISKLPLTRALINTGVFRTVARHKHRKKLVDSMLARYPITLEEAATIITALEIGADMVYLLRPQARRIARELGIEAGGPIRFFLECFRKGLLSTRELEEAIVMELINYPIDN